MNLQSLIDALGERVRVPFSLTMPGGHGYRSGVGSPLFHIILRSEATLASCVMHGHIGLLDAYFNQDVDIEGDLGAALAAGMAGGLDRLPSAIGQVENELHELRFFNRRKHHAKSNARAHYGLGTEFFRLWLDDPLMMYTCVYWPQGTLTLEDAQRQKIDHVCRKLRLSAGERFVDIGCGFGGFIVW
ncbi:SAM-dependent methyltransferase [Hydrogenophaga sp. BPS33]|uniref:SAM-dependent methyltransferase n=1 Tax=Hydrogenophaga sp. BPS33 TaxID=2651974 RepID=UPI00135A9011|nr:class I SAM-dependent methyltransferase [Hydrogenophaga sp. BPS33]